MIRNLFRRVTITTQKYKRAYTTETENLKKTPLYDFHVKYGGKMVPFAGYSMPLQYSNLGLLGSHLHTRKHASLFDVSHMLQTRLTGKDKIKFLEKLVVADLEKLLIGNSTLSVFTNENGGIIDDTVICKHDDHLYIVSNAACADKDLAHIQKHLSEFQKTGGEAELKVIDDHALLALQGPKAVLTLEKLTGQNLNDFKFMTGRFMSIKEVDCHVTRSGYTGEDGFEISIPTSEATRLAELILDDPFVELAGLGPRDSLRLEAGLCLYGHDLDETTTPIEAGLSWTIGKRRKEEGGFLGADIILKQLQHGTKRRRVGMIVEGAPARENAEIKTQKDEIIGKVTSGVPSPTLKENVAMGYVETGYHKLGTILWVKVRARNQKAYVTRMPFVPTKYYK
ncbi:771_t:CDS:2 [Ambispora gerdemannii]|uniref:Aminomethyltransferase n=1 Tax=Ambispora gerdemannii TaxID=144530 RepID=A0A9N8ZGJ7_9GLOM|nr:771_t:CDS:2 [Ambispora gerdemannii]